MSCRNVLLTGVIVAGLSSIGCAGDSSARLSPTAPSPDGNASSTDGATRNPQTPGPTPPPTTGTCVADQARWAIGQPGTTALLERARVDATASIARFIRPDEAVTMEFSPARLNLHLDANEIVRSVICG
jgi:hypothetical protein